jgi:homoserine O-acetyltransferase/O-succinyltransferase
VRGFLLALAATLTLATAAQAQAPQVKLSPHEGDFVVHDFKFRTGESLPELRLHYTTLGQPTRDAKGHVTNAVLILHGTGGTGQQFFRPQFADVLFGPGQLLDTSRYYIILPDDIGHGKSSKPSDGLKARFPQYDYADMVEAEHRLVSAGLGVDHLRLVMGTSMGCMHTFLWGEAYPSDMDALMPLACLPVPIAGRNRLWRAMVIDAIKADPAWMGGDYASEPVQGLRTAEDLTVIVGSAPLQMQKTYPTREAADEAAAKLTLAGLDANDEIYQIDSSRTYDPDPDLGRIVAPMMWINSADDFINPPELGIAEREVKKIKVARFIVIPVSEATHGHGTHTWAAVWKDHLAELLKQTER